MYELWLVPSDGSRWRVIGTLTDEENAGAAADGICAHYLDGGQRVGIGVRAVGAPMEEYTYWIDASEIEQHRRTMS